MADLKGRNLVLNRSLAGERFAHGLPKGWELAPYEHGVHFWRIESRVDAEVEMLPEGGPDGMPALRLAHREFKLLDPVSGYLPTPGRVEWLGIRCILADIPAAEVDRVFRLVYWGRSTGNAYVHTRIEGPHFQNDPEGVAWQKKWRRIDHTFLLPAGETCDGIFFYVRAREPGDSAEMSGFDVRYEGEFKPRRFRPRPHRTRVPYPDERAVLRVNPPTFVWADAGRDARHELEVGKTRDFSGKVQRFGPLDVNFHKPPVLLEPGRYFWRRRLAGSSEWSAPISFVMPGDAVPYVTPAFEQILAGLRKGHPRLFATRDTLDSLRRTVTETNRPEWLRLSARASRRVGEPVEGDFASESYNPTHDADALWDVLFAWLVTGERPFADCARRLLDALLRVPVTGITEHRHSEINYPLIYALGAAYDWMYDLLSEPERRGTRDAIARRCENIYDFYRPGTRPFASFEISPYDSHSSYMHQAIIFGALAIVDEAPEVRRFLEYALMTSISFYPLWSETDGSWAQGIGYFSPYLAGRWRDLSEACYVRTATGLDFFEKPFFRGVRDFVLYGCPPFGTNAIFGDMGRKDMHNSYDLARCACVSRAIAEEFDDPYAKWHAEVGDLPSRYDIHSALHLGAAPHVKAKPPTDLPPAKLFPDTGWALLHTDLTGRDDVFFAFKSSPYGSLSHSHADQNSFTLACGGHHLLTDSGHYAWYGSPHHLGFAKHSRAHNTILVNGRGQMINEIAAGGHITHFATSDEIDYVVGDAQAAYGTLLERFDRHVVFLRPNVFVIFDDVAAEEPSTWDWLLHAPEYIHADEASQTIRTQNGAWFVKVRLHGPKGLRFSTTRGFDPPVGPNTPPEQRALMLDEFHFAAHSAEPRREARFVAFIAVGEHVRRENPPEPAFFESGSWTAVSSEAGDVCFRTGDEISLRLGRRDIETDARTVVLRPSGAFLVADGSYLLVDGRRAFKAESPVKQHIGRL